MQALHPIKAIFLAGASTLFVAAMLSDLTYARSFELQWKNFASWLLVGGLALSFVALIWSFVDIVRYRNDRGALRLVHLGSLLVLWILGFVNALVHARDAWGSMPMGLVLSVIIVLLSVAAVYSGFAGYQQHRARVLS